MHGPYTQTCSLGNFLQFIATSQHIPSGLGSNLCIQTLIFISIRRQLSTLASTADSLSNIGITSRANQTVQIASLNIHCLLQSIRLLY